MQPKNAHRNALSGKCELCSREAKHTCRFCHRRVCDLHYDSMRDMCVICAGKGKAPLQAGGKGTPKRLLVQLIPGSICAVCSKEAKHVCKNCGRSVCDDHYVAGEGLCIICHIKNEREKMKEDARQNADDEK